MKNYELVAKYEIPKRKLDYWCDLGLIRFETDPNNGYRLFNHEGEEDLQRLIVLDLIKVDKVERDSYLKLFDILPVSALENLFGDRLDEERDRIMRIFDRADDYIAQLKQRKQLAKEDA